MTRPTRFWPLATIIILPVLVLAGVAAYFLAEQRKTVLAEAKATAESMAASAAVLWEQRSQLAPRGTDVRLYADPPVPGASSPAAGKLDAAVAAGDWEAVRALRDAPEDPGTTASGLPVRVLAAWALYQAQPVNAHAEPLRVLALKTQPSALSPRILEALKGEYSWIMEGWAMTEAQRYELRAALADGWSPPPPAPPPGAENTAEEEAAAAARPSIVLRRASILPRGSSAAAAPAGGRGLVRIMGWPDGSTAVALDDRWPQAVAHEVQNTQHRAGLDWASLKILEADAPPPAGPPHPLAVLQRPGFTVFVHLSSEPALYAGYWRLVWWVAGIIGGALGIALLGLWLIRRTLHRERRLGELKSQFVSSVSHELRAPIGSLRLMAEGLASGKVSGAAADEFHRLMAGEGARLSSLIENVLDFARIEQGRKEYHLAETDVAALVQDAVKLMQPHAEARGLKITCECEPLPFIPKVDAGAFQQALINLLDNAVKFTSPAARSDKSDLSDLSAIRITLAADPSRDTWFLTVTDHGAGIPAEEHTRIFERFYRLGNELRRETTGTGIGLALVKHIVEGHGGTVRVRSELGKGSEFKMEFSGFRVQGSESVTGADR